MTDEIKPPKKLVGRAKAIVENQGKMYSPEKKGRMVRGPLDWSLDDLIAYKQNGTAPMRIPDPDLLYKLGTMGVSMNNAAELFDISREKFSSNLDWLENWQKGRAECAARVRAKIVEQALDENVLNAMIYLDKIMGGDQVIEQVQVDVRNTQLTAYDTDALLKAMEVPFKENNDSGNSETDSN
jgi:hypothetical protein